MSFLTRIFGGHKHNTTGGTEPASKLKKTKPKPKAQNIPELPPLRLSTLNSSIDWYDGPKVEKTAADFPERIIMIWPVPYPRLIGERYQYGMQNYLKALQTARPMSRIAFLGGYSRLECTLDQIRPMAFCNFPRVFQLAPLMAMEGLLLFLRPQLRTGDRLASVVEESVVPALVEIVRQRRYKNDDNMMILMQDCVAQLQKVVCAEGKSAQRMRYLAQELKAIECEKDNERSDATLSNDAGPSH